MNDHDVNMTFDNFNLNAKLLKSLNDMGYINPSPIQKKCIPYLLSGNDVIGMAQTGSGKTAAFALPLLNNINVKFKKTQILILTPTRELAIQISQSITEFSKYIRSIKIVALYGGQNYTMQLRILKKGPQVVVGTPGRLLDHLQKKTLNLFYLKCLVLDEADEMLRMGFIEDVTKIMKNIPDKHQTALFSATMPDVIRRIAKKFMQKPKEIKINSNILTTPDIQQSYWIVYGRKTDALIRFLEIEKFDAAIIFVRTKSATTEVSEILEKNGYNSAALNGDMNQSIREKTLEKLKKGKIDILIATDVAARGLDVERISLVINYDIPMHAESYVHRIGRTGRAGRSGKALLFVENRERRLLKNIEKIMKVKISETKLPNSTILTQNRLNNFIIKIEKYLVQNNLKKYKDLLNIIFSKIKNIDTITLSAILLKIAQENKPLILKPDVLYSFHKKKYDVKRDYTNNYKNFSNNIKHVDNYRIELGKNNNVNVQYILKSLKDYNKIKNYNIGNIKIFNNYTIIELSKKISNFVLKNCKNIKIFDKIIDIKKVNKFSEINNFNKKNIKKSKKYKKIQKENYTNSNKPSNNKKRISSKKIKFKFNKRFKNKEKIRSINTIS